MNPYGNYNSMMYPLNYGMVTTIVHGEQEAISYPVAAGSTVVLLDFDNSKFWLKSTDQNGLPQSFKAYAFKEEVQQSSNIQNNSNYATKDDLDSLHSDIAVIKKMLDEIVK